MEKCQRVLQSVSDDDGTPYVRHCKFVGLVKQEQIWEMCTCVHLYKSLDKFRKISENSENFWKDRMLFRGYFQEIVFGLATAVYNITTISDALLPMHYFVVYLTDPV